MYLRIMEQRISLSSGLLSLSPLVVFLAFYVTLSIVANDFYAVPITVAFMLTCIYSLFILREKTWAKRFEVITYGASQPGLLLMIWIFILAGAFASTAKQMGAIETTVNLSLAFLPSQFILSGLFLAACFISLSVGTSVGTIAALVPIAANVASQTEQSLPMMIAIVVGGAFFGDNLSFISDTTIMATRTQGCELRDKFRANIWIALPAALIALALYCFMGLNVSASSHTSASDFILVLPYLFVLISALCGMNVIGVLCLGTALAGFLGLIRGSFTLIGWMQAMNTGIMGMSELIIVTLMAAGLIEVIRRTNGIEFILQRLTKHIRSSKGAELSMAGLVILTDLCTANNTIAILTVGPLAKEISQQYGIHPRRTASILDTFSCFAQGIIPYGAQLLIASGLAEINPIEIIPHLYYPFILALIAILYILMKKTTQHITYGQDSEILPPSDN